MSVVTQNYAGQLGCAKSYLKTFVEYHSFYNALVDIEEIAFAYKASPKFIINAFLALHSENLAYLEYKEEIKEEIDSDEVREYLETIPLEVSRRYCPDTGEATGYSILLCTGGPAVRIIGDLGGYDEPESAEIQAQDWGTGWEYLRMTEEEETALMWFVNLFYFGE